MEMYFDDLAAGVDRFGEDFGPLSPSPIPLEEGKAYRLESGLQGRRVRVLLLWAPRVVMPENELRAKCVVLDPGSSGLKSSTIIEPLAHSFREDKI